MNWWKSAAWLAVVVVGVAAVSFGAWAQGAAKTDSSATPTASGKCAATCPAYVDANGDGICDNKTADGRRQRCRAGQSGACPNYIDANGDGVCDNKAQACAGKGQGGGQGNGTYGGGNGQCNRKRQGRG